LHPDGTLDTELISSYTLGRFQTDEFILCGQGTETFEPRFNYHGFRYVEVAGLTTKPTLDTLTGRWVHSDVEPVGEFACSDSRLNRLHEMIRRTHLCGLHSIPTDCPHREKLGWTIEGCDCIEIANVPWFFYQYYGDTRALAEAYTPIRRYVEWLQSTAKDDTLQWGLGDLGEVGSILPKRTPVPVTSTCGYYNCVMIAHLKATILGKQDEAKQYAALAEKIYTSFNKHFLDPATSLYASDSQTAQAMPLWLGLVPPDSNDCVVERLVENILQKRQGHVNTGMLGTGSLVHALLNAQRADVAWTMITSEDYPGWLNMINNGVTTLWEFWKPTHSLNHPDFGVVGIFFYKGIGGIRPDPSGPGFKKIIIRPEVVGDLTWAKVSYRSIHGLIVMDWKVDGHRFTLKVTIPANTSATVHVPSKDATSI
jgi:alpha-L-rhamnosidase